jgi:hypothetical protein
MRYWFIGLLVIAAADGWAQQPSAADYGSLQEAINANPGKVLFVPQAVYEISEPIYLTTDNSGLAGYGTIVQTDTDACIVAVSNAKNVRIEDLTLTRPEGRQDCDDSGIEITNSSNVLLKGIRLLDNRSRHSGINIENSHDCCVVDSEVCNYKRVAIDDRTAEGNSLYGYAFFCIDGTGIVVQNSQNVSLLNNRIVENNLLPTKEIKEQHQLGTLTDGKYPTNPGDLGRNAVSAGYVSNWHQGSAIVVTGPEVSRDIFISGNYIENCAQGIDLHCDYVRCIDNTVISGMIGVKMTHGSKHLIVAENLLTRIDLWGILYNPGAASHGGVPATADVPAKPENDDGGSIIANNIITEYGYGNEYWNWGGASSDQSGSYAIAFYDGQLPENPPLSDVLVTGNMVYDDSNSDESKAPRYRYAVFFGSWHSSENNSSNMPRNIKLHGNMFHPGSGGISNVEIP